MSNKKSFALFLLIIFAVTSLFSGCGSKTGDNNTIRMVIADPKTLDPRRVGESEGIIINDQVQEGLTNTNDATEAVPAGAEKWEANADATVWTFHLRKDAKWSNGDPVTAKDYVYSWTTAVAPDFANDRTEDFYDIKNAEQYNKGECKVEDVGVKAIDDYTLQVTLKAPRSYFPLVVAGASLKPVSAKVCQANPKAYQDPKTMVFNGPFKIASFTHNSKYELVRNDQYWDKANVKPEKILFQVSDDAASQLSMFRSGQTDYINQYPSSETIKLMKEGFVNPRPKNGVYYYIFNVKKKPFDNKKVRQALTLAINRQQIIDNALQSGQKPALAEIPFGNPDAAPGSDFRTVGGNYYKDNDIATAKKLLAEAGYPDGKGFPEVTIKYNTSEGHKKIAEIIQEMWKDNLNIKVKLVNEEWKVFLMSLGSHDFEVARMGGIAGIPDASTFFDGMLPGGGSNYGDWENPKFTATYNQARVEPDNSKRIALIHESENVFMDDMVHMPIYFYVNAPAIAKNLKGIVSDSMLNIYLKGAYKE